MNISDKNIEKLIEMKKSFYEEIKSEVKDKILDDGNLYIKLDKIEKDYDYFFTSKDYILIVKKDDNIEISDNFDANGILIENKNNYNLLQCKKKILNTILDDIEKYNKINTKISAL